MTSPQDTAEEQWKRLMSGKQSSQVMGVPASPQVQSPHETKADEQTRLVRKITSEAAHQRGASVARLKQARLDKEAHDKAQATLIVPKTKHRACSAD